MDNFEPLTTGLIWRNHFRASLQEGLEAPIRDRWVDSALADSLRQFQLGESSDGVHLLQYARTFGARTGDPWLGEAMALFIQEENRHAHWLGEFLRAQGEPLLKRHWVDSVFRFIRKPLGFGPMVAVLVCAEIIAVPYYTAVRRASRSEWLRAICWRLLRDEAHHLRFQAANLGTAWRRFVPLFSIRASGAVTGHMRSRVAGTRCCATRRGFGFGGFVCRCLDLLDEVHAGAEASRRSYGAYSKEACVLAREEA